MDWEATKARLSSLATRHHGRATDFGRLLELAPPVGGERIRVTCTGDRSVRIEAGWFLCRTLDIEDDDRHLLDVVTAVMTGGAREYVVLDDGVPAGDGYLIEHAGGALAARREPHSSDVVERAVPPWRAPHTGTEVRVVPSTPEEVERLLTGARATHADRLQRHRGLGREDAAARAADEVAALAPQGSATPDHVFLSAHHGDELLGGLWAALQGPDRAGSAWIHHVEVVPAARRQGVAARLVREAAAAVRAPGVTHLGVRVLGDDAGAGALYARLGFTVTAQQMSLEL